MVAVAIALWLPQPTSLAMANTHDLAAGTVGLVVAAVLLLVPMSERGQPVRWAWQYADAAGGSQQYGLMPEAISQWSRPKQAMIRTGGPSLILVGALMAIAQTGGCESPLALLLLLPALALDTEAGERGILLITSVIWLAMLPIGLLFAPQPLNGIQILAGLCASTGWAAASALVYWLRVLLAERRTVALAAHGTPKALTCEHDTINRPRRTLLTHVSHELLTPLAAIQAGAGLLGSLAISNESANASRMSSTEVIPQAHDADVWRNVARNVQRNAVRLTLLVEDLLESARIEEAPAPLRPAWHNCAAALRRATEAVAVLCESQRQQAVWSAIPEELTYWGDARRVDQVLINLLANAHKYAGAGATITLTARAWAQGVRWEVGNDGPRIGEHTLRHLFEQYYRAPDLSGEGHGLGLSIAQSLVELHGGSIWAENSAESGCRFIFWLPNPKRDEMTQKGGHVVHEGDK